MGASVGIVAMGVRLKKQHGYGRTSGDSAVMVIRIVSYTEMMGGLSGEEKTTWTKRFANMISKNAAGISPRWN